MVRRPDRNMAEPYPNENPEDEIDQTTFKAFLNQQDKGWDYALRARSISHQRGRTANGQYCCSR